MANKIKFSNYDDFKKYEGKEIGVSEYCKIEQSRINQFAEAISDYQWIHLDEEKAKKSLLLGRRLLMVI